jgi:3-oxoacyl-[acyl-carrier protein] reductase
LNPTESPVALVTEASNPILAATARRLADDGLRVLACHTAVPAAQPMGADSDDGTSGVFCGDLSIPAEAARLAETALERYGHIDVLVLGPAAPPRHHRPGSSEKSPLDLGTEPLQPWINCVEALLPELERSRGRIVSIVHSAARYRSGYFRPQNETSSATSEALTHSAIFGLTRQLTLELTPKGVRLNVVVAGLVEDAKELEAMTDQERRFLLEEISLRRLGRPDEVAAVAAFLASDASMYVTGNAIDVNGGWWMS